MQKGKLNLTWACRLMEKAVHLVAEGRAEFMVASHNQESIEKATKLMHELDLPPRESPVYFGQLLGMADPLTYVLGANGYKVKLIPLRGAIWHLHWREHNIIPLAIGQPMQTDPSCSDCLTCCTLRELFEAVFDCAFCLHSLTTQHQLPFVQSM